MKKYYLIIGFLALVSSITGCGKQGADKISTEQEIETITTESTEEATTEEKVETVTYTQEMADNIKTFLESHKSMDIIQEMSNGDVSGVKYSDVIYTMKFDIKNKVIQTIVQDNSTDEKKTSYYLSNIKDENYYSKDSEEQEWKKEEKETLSLDCNIKKYKTCYDLYKYLLNGNELEVGTSGTISENYYYFEVVKPAEKDAIKGVEYDSLGNHTATYIFKSDDGKMFIPVSVIITVDFTVGGEKYDCTSTVQFTNISDDKLPLPELDDKKDGDESSSESN